MPFDGDAEDVAQLLAAACVGDRRRTASLVLWARLSTTYRRAAMRALEAWCANEYADAQRAYVDAVLAVGTSPAPSPLAMPLARAALVALCEEAFGPEAVFMFGLTVLLCGKMDARAYMCVQGLTCRLCGASMLGGDLFRDGETSRASTAADAQRCQDVENSLRRTLCAHRALSRTTSAAPTFTFAHVRCQMKYCRPFWSCGVHDQPVARSSPPAELLPDSVWGVALPMLLPLTGSDADVVARNRTAREAFARERTCEFTYLPDSMRPGLPPPVGGDEFDVRKYAKATPRMKAVLRTDAFGQVHSEENVLHLHDCFALAHGSGDPDPLPRFRTCVAPRRLHMAWVLPHPAVRSEDTLLGSFAGDEGVYSDLQTCLRNRLQSAEASVVRWERELARNEGRLADLRAELGKLPGMPSDALGFLDGVHHGALASLGVLRFEGVQKRLRAAVRLLADLRWLFVADEWEKHVALDGDRAPFVSSHAANVRQLLQRARVTTQEALHGRDTFHPRGNVTLTFDAAAWGGVLWAVENGPFQGQARGVLLRQFLSGLGSGLAASGARYALHRHACRAALDWLFDIRQGFEALAERVHREATAAATAGADQTTTATTGDDQTTTACVLGKLLASFHHTSCAVRVVDVVTAPETRELNANVSITVVPRLCRGTVGKLERHCQFVLSVSELECELSSALSAEAAGRKGPQWRELESAAAALLARPPAESSEWVALRDATVQRAIDALVRVGFEDGASRRARTSALRITRLGWVLQKPGRATMTRPHIQKMHDEQQRVCAHYPNACACAPVDMVRSGVGRAGAA